MSLEPPSVLFSFPTALAMTSNNTKMASVRSSLFHSPISCYKAEASTQSPSPSEIRVSASSYKPIITTKQAKKDLTNFSNFRTIWVHKMSKASMKAAKTLLNIYLQTF